MAVPTSITDLSTIADNNSPAGSDPVGPNLDNFLRSIQAIIRQTYDDVTGDITTIQNTFFSNLTSVAGTNTITANLPSTVTSLAIGPYDFIPANSNTGSATINITGNSSFGAKQIWLNGAVLVGYEMRKNCPIRLYWDGTRFHITGGAHGGDGVPITTVTSLASSFVPSNHLLCYGQAISRTAYADLFALVGTTHGNGDGSTTFNLPDMRGRSPFGKDNMGGVAANRITSGVSNISGTTLGATGGDERLVAHAHNGTTDVEGSSHSHSGSTSSDGAHTHTVPASGAGGAGFLFKDGADSGSPQATDSQGAHTHTFTTGTESSTHTHTFTTSISGSGNSANIPPAIIFNWAIKC